MIRLDGVQKRYMQGRQEVLALRGVSLDVPKGDFVVVMGPSGSGKSTMLNLVGGLDRPTTGEVTLDGTRVSQMDDDALTLFRRRRIGFVFQFFNLLPTMTAEENVALPLLLDGRDMASTRADVEALLERVGLSGRRTHRADELSGGERQRVALARALVTKPAIVLADEPTGNLDSKTGEGILGLLRESNEALGHTIVMVTHDPNAAAYGKRVIRLKDGVIEA